MAPQGLGHLRLVARQNLRRAEYTPSTRRGDGVGADIHENSYAVDATHDGATTRCGTCTKCIFKFYDSKNYILFGSKSAFLAVVPGRNHSARSKTSAHSSFSLLKSSLEAPACVTPAVGQALSMAQN